MYITTVKNTWMAIFVVYNNYHFPIIIISNYYCIILIIIIAYILTEFMPKKRIFNSTNMAHISSCRGVRRKIKSRGAKQARTEGPSIDRVGLGPSDSITNLMVVGERFGEQIDSLEDKTWK